MKNNVKMLHHCLISTLYLTDNNPINRGKKQQRGIYWVIQLIYNNYVVEFLLM